MVGVADHGARGSHVSGTIDRTSACKAKVHLNKQCIDIVFLLFLIVVMSGAKPKLGPQRPEETQSVEPAPLFRESGYHKSPLAVSSRQTRVRAFMYVL